MTEYPKRLIEVDLPIRRISEHARREKSIRHGHISTLHIWWARRPLAACRAVICASLWPDPADRLCPDQFRTVARELMKQWADDHLSLVSQESYRRFVAIQKDPARLDNDEELRGALLDFIADFANWDNSTKTEFLETSRMLTQVAHLSMTEEFSIFDLSGNEQSKIQNLKSKIQNLPRPLVVDPFAGGGAIPLEALRVGADAFASDLNPVAVLLNKVVLEFIPEYGEWLADEVRRWGEWIKKRAEKELSEFYPKDEDGATPIAYLWARTIQCEGPGCGAQVPLMRSLWLAKKSNRSVALQIVTENKRVDFRIIQREGGEWREADNPKSKIQNPKFDGTVRRGSATCPVCGYTTPVTSVRRQLKERRGGAADARLFCVVTTRPGEQGRFYRLPVKRDLDAVKRAAEELERRKQTHKGTLSLVPDEPTPQGGGSGAGRAFSQRNYGMDRFEDLFTPRQALALTTLARLVREVPREMDRDWSRESRRRASEGIGCGFGDNFIRKKIKGLSVVIQIVLGLAVSRFSDICNAFCRWENTKTQVRNLFTRQAIPMMWDFAEPHVLADAAGNYDVTLGTMIEVLQKNTSLDKAGNVDCASAISHPLPNDAASAFISDPPYYDAVPYADLSDFFYVWLKRTLPKSVAASFTDNLTPKEDECIVDEVKGKDRVYFERTMGQAMAEGRRILRPDGIGVVVFAHKSTAGWEAQLQAMIDAGWTMTGSWPIDTEMGTRLRARDSAALASSIHIVCRPRENADGSMREEIGDWRDVLQALPRRIHEWMPRLAAEGVVGADAIFACLGPALEIFSRYSRVEKPNGDQVLLREYLEYVWAAVAREALNLIFTGADATGFEEDARVTAMWLWTLQSTSDSESTEIEEPLDDESEIENPKSKIQNSSSFMLEYDAARKIAQGLGANLEKLASLIEIKGDKARLLSVSERARHLFGNQAEAPVRRKKSRAQTTLFDISMEDTNEATWGDMGAPATGASVLDRVHQSMLLFASGRSEALKRFLVEDGAGRDERFWRLAQALSALYPSNGDEKRWVDGVLARKKGMGFSIFDF